MKKQQDHIKFYLAPMEGVTSYIFRNAQEDFFHNVDKFFTPFIAANQTGKLKSKEKTDILPENNQGKYIVPQILTNHADDFIRTVEELLQYGYQEVNLNLGCPAGTVVSKCKGAGFLSQPERLDQFLDEIFTRTDSKVKISIKTRLGINEYEEFHQILEIYNKYPLCELIIHPRLQKDYYNNTPNLEIFEEACKQSKHEICYNGDIFTAKDYATFHNKFPKITKVMMGRGLIGNPGLIKSIKEEGYSIDKKTLFNFHNRVLEDYRAILSGDVNVLYKMKELWYYMGPLFEDAEKERKKIRKTNHLSEYKAIVTHLFREKDLAENAGFHP